MASEGTADMDRQLTMTLGEIKGQLTSLIREFEDHRDQTRDAVQALLSKLEHVEVDVHTLKSVIPALQSQVYSNKAEIDRVKGDMDLVKTIITRTMGIFTILLTIGGMIFTGVWWAVSHWSEAISMLRGMFGWK